MITKRIFANLFFVLSLLSVSSCYADVLYPQTALPQCRTVPSVEELTNDFVDGAIEARKALTKLPYDDNSTWDKITLAQNMKLNKTIERYLKGQIGQSIKSIHLKNHDAKSLHHILLQKGFSHHRIVLNHNINNKMLYLKRNGRFTSNPKENDAVPHDIYVHPDGGMIRIKPEGIPTTHPTIKRHYPQAVKCVLFDATLHCHNQICEYDTSYKNEAFKVTDKNIPVPKSTAKEEGFNWQPHLLPEIAYRKKAFLKGWADTIMAACHQEISSNYDHCY